MHGWLAFGVVLELSLTDHDDLCIQPCLAFSQQDVDGDLKNSISIDLIFHLFQGFSSKNLLSMDIKS